MQGIRALSLDWYGTLVKGGTDRLVDHLRERVAARGLDVGPVLRRREELIASLRDREFLPFQERDEWILATLYDEFALPGDPGADAAALKRAHMQVTAYEDAPGFLERLDGLPKHVVSNADDDMIQAGLDETGLAVDGVVTSEKARAYKPAPRIFEAAVEAIGIPAEAILHVGDSFTADVEGAKAAGMRAAWVQRTGLPRPDGATVEPDLVARSLTDVADALGL